MPFNFSVLVVLVWAVPGLLARPSLEVPACPSAGTVLYNTSVPDKGLFPPTQVDLCYDDSSIHIKFTAFEEKDFYCMSSGPHSLLLASIEVPFCSRAHTDPGITDNQNLTTNGEIYNYEVMEAFIVRLLAGTRLK